MSRPKLVSSSTTLKLIKTRTGLKQHNTYISKYIHHKVLKSVLCVGAINSSGDNHKAASVT